MTKIQNIRCQMVLTIGFFCFELVWDFELRALNFLVRSTREHGLAPSGVYHTTASPRQRRRAYLLRFTYRPERLFRFCGTFPLLTPEEQGGLVLPTTHVHGPGP